MRSIEVFVRGAASTLVAAAAVGMLIAAGCGGERTDPRAGSSSGRLEIAVAPLNLAQVTDATFDLIVKAGAETVWKQVGLKSSQFGNGQGDLSYVGPCVGGEMNSVTLTMQTLSVVGQNPLPETEWVKPDPVTISRMCVENADIPIAFNLTIMRSAEQGFFDVAVNFEDIFCSAKLDCTTGDLLHNGLDRDDTIVLGFACAAGEGQDTTIYMSRISIECDEDLDMANGYEVVYPINQSAGPGQLDDDDSIPGVFEVATYQGSEELPGYDKCYWNTAIGVEIDAEDAVRFDGKRCRLLAKGTAASVAFDDGFSPDNSVYPVIQWDVPLTDDAGSFICDAEHRLNEGAQVTTRYTDMNSERFAYGMDCATATVLSNGVTECSGTLPGVGGATFTDTGEGVEVTVTPSNGGQDIVSPIYKLSDEYHLAGCCVDPCCDQAP